jgi:hypothetical protein
MRTTATAGAFFLIGATLAWAGVGCTDRNYTYPFYGMDWDTDSETDTDSDTGGDGDGDGDGDTGDSDTCPEDTTDDLGRCIRYVDWDALATVCGTSWDSAFTNIQDGIDSAYAAAQILGSCEVWVAAGTYRSYVDAFTDAIYLRTNVQVYGGFQGDEVERDQRDIRLNETILDGRDELELNASYHVVMGAELGELDGFTVTGGYANGDTPHHRGGGLYSNSTRTIVRNCTFRGNRAIDGGAVFLYDSTPRLESCLLEENTAENGGAVFVLNGTAELVDVTILHNTSTSMGGGVYLKSVYGDCNPTFVEVAIETNTALLDGGGVFVDNCHPEITDSRIGGNTASRNGGGLAGQHGSAKLVGSTLQGNAAWGSGGGAYSFDTAFELTGSWVVENRAAEQGGGLRLAWSDSLVEATLIAANTAGGDGGGIFVELDFPQFVNSLITGNRGTRGGGAFNGARAVATYVNTVFHGNRATDLAGGVFNADLSEVDLFNDIVYGDSGDEIYDEKGSETEVAFCDVQGGYAGIQVIDADPLFAAPGAWIDPGTPDDASDDSWSYGDYHLQAGSPCIDQADDAASPEADAYGNDWIDIADAGLPDVAADIGAYDYQL